MYKNGTARVVYLACSAAAAVLSQTLICPPKLLSLGRIAALAIATYCHTRLN